MELISAQYEPTTGTWVGGAQDNSVQLAGPHASAKTRAVAIVGGDGTGTAIDTSVSPARFYGTSQFYGNLADGDRPRRRRRLGGRSAADRDGGKAGVVEDEEEDGKEEVEEEDMSFGFATFGASGKIALHGVAAVEKRSYFDIEQFPFFDHPYALNTAAKSDAGLPLVLWTRASSTRGAPSAFYTVASANAAPVLDVASGGDVLRNKL